MLYLVSQKHQAVAISERSASSVHAIFVIAMDPPSVVALLLVRVAKKGMPRLSSITSPPTPAADKNCQLWKVHSSVSEI